MHAASLILSALLSIPGAPPHEGIVRLEVQRAGRRVPTNGVVLSDGSVLIGTGLNSPHIEQIRVTTSDGRTHDVAGIVAVHWAAPFVLLKVDWNGVPPPPVVLRDVDHFDTESVFLARAGADPVQANVEDTQSISSSIQVRPDTFLDPFEWSGAAATDDEGRLLGMTTSFSVGATISFKSGLPDAMQRFGCTPAAWVQPLLASKRDTPITFADWAATGPVHRAAVKARLESLRRSMPRNLDDAIQQAEDLVNDLPWHPEAWVLLADIRLERNEADQAIKAASKATEIDPGSHEATLIIAEAAIRKSDLKAAQAAMHRAVHMHHEDLHDYFEDATYFFYAQLPQEANLAVDKVLQTDPEHDGAQRLKQLIENSLNR